MINEPLEESAKHLPPEETAPKDDQRKIGT